MLRIKTDIKNVSFRAYKDLLLYMKNENLKKINYEVYLFYWDKEPIFKMSEHTIEEVEKVIKGED